MVVQRRDGVEHAKVLDFGLAKLRERGADRARDQLRRAGDRDALLHGARAGARRGARRARRHLQPGRDAVPRADRRAAVRRAVADERAVEAPHRRRRAAAHARAGARAAAGRRSHRAARDGEVRRGSLRLGRGGAAGSRARAGSGAGRRATSVATVALRRPQAVARATGEAPTLALGTARRARSANAAAATVAAAPSAAAPMRARTRIPTPRRRRSDEASWTGCGVPTSTTTNGRCAGSGCSRRLGLPLIGLIVAGAAAFVLWKRPWERPDNGLEHEPNNTAGYANLLFQAPVRGTIGTPLNDREGDVDYFRVPAGKGPRSLHARLEGIPGVDLVLELFDAQGRRLAKSDARGPRPRRMAAAHADRTDGGVRRRARGLDRRHAADSQRAGSVHADRALGPAASRLGAGAQRLAGRRDAAAGGGRVRGYLGSGEDRDWFSHHADRRRGWSGHGQRAGRRRRHRVPRRGREEGRQQAGRRATTSSSRWTARPASRCSSASRESSTARRREGPGAAGARGPVRAGHQRDRQVSATKHKSEGGGVARRAGASSFARWRPKRSAIRCSMQ